MHISNKEIKDQLRVIQFMQSHKQFVDFVYARGIQKLEQKNLSHQLT